MNNHLGIFEIIMLTMSCLIFTLAAPSLIFIEWLRATKEHKEKNIKGPVRLFIGYSD